MIDYSSWPTHMTLVARRLQAVGYNSSGDTFLYTSYLAETAIKSIAIVLYAALKENFPDEAYRMGYYLIQADGLGNWETAIRQCTNQPLASYISKEFSSLVFWATKKRSQNDTWFTESKIALKSIFMALGEDDADGKISSAREIITSLVRIRNKTKAHGAVGQDFFNEENEPYIQVVNNLIEHCPVFSWGWYHIHCMDKSTRYLALSSNDPKVVGPDLPITFARETGLYIVPDQSTKAYVCSDLIKSNIECTNFMFPNGGFNSQGRAEFIDYASGKTSQVDASIFLTQPAQLPISETQGLPNLDIQSNVFGNLPAIPKGYVERKILQDQLEAKLHDRNHPIITLHGRGGVGKTSLALFVAHKIASQDVPHFEQIVWFSARDIDLRPSGPSRVKPAVLDLNAISASYGSLYNTKTTIEDFANVLQAIDSPKKGTLFIFDNFETLSDVPGIHEFLDMYTCLPNKVLITSRERAFKADYPIAVRGMEYPEASAMLTLLAQDLHIEGLITPKVIKDIFDYAEGHAYVMRVLVGEIAKEEKYVPVNQVISKRLDIIDAVFERSFNKLSDAGRYVFLTIANWRSSVSEIALLVTLSHHGIDVDSGIDECKRLSLITEDLLLDEQPCYYAPQLARIFGRKKLEGDPDRLLIQEDLETIRKFGVMDINQHNRQSQEEQINNFISWCMSDEIDDEDLVGKLDRIIESIANLWPRAWLDLANFRIKRGFEQKRIEYAFRRAVEEMPFRKEVWRDRANYAKTIGDESTMIASLVSAVEADPSDHILISDVAFKLCRYINEHKTDIPKARRGVYLASVRAHMEQVSDLLDSTGLSRLAWLFLLEDDQNNAWKYACLGHDRDPDNEYCSRIIKNLEFEGYHRG